MALFEVIKYDGNPDVFAWKHPIEALGTWTQLIVNQSQEVVFFKDGRALDLYGAGRHTLSTSNIPVLNKLINLPFGGNSPFAAEVWFVNKVSTLDMKWGTQGPIQLQDPRYHIIVPVRAFGQIAIRIKDSRQFLVKLVGTLKAFGKEDLSNYFRGIIVMNINSLISSYLNQKKISILEIHSHMGEMTEHFKRVVSAAFESFGVQLEDLFIKSLSAPEDDPSVKRLRDALARKAEMNIVGYNYQQERAFDTLEGAATNESNAGALFMGAGMGLGMGAGLGDMFAAQMPYLGRVMQAGAAAGNRPCPKCSAVNDAQARYCGGCGAAMDHSPAQQESVRVISCHACGKPLAPGTKFCAHCGDRYHACARCGADNPPESAVCIQCRTPLPRPCSHCGQSLEAGAKFCPDCGKSVAAARCVNCGQEMPPHGKFCVNCGSRAVTDREGGGTG